MTAAPEGSRMWKNLLLEGQVDSRIARRAGTTLAQLGNSAAGKESVRKRFEDRTVFDELRLDPYYRVTAARHPDLREKFDRLIADSLEIRTGSGTRRLQPQEHAGAGRRNVPDCF